MFAPTAYLQEVDTNSQPKLKQLYLISLEINRIPYIASYSSLKAKEYNIVPNNNPLDPMDLTSSGRPPKYQDV